MKKNFFTVGAVLFATLQFSTLQAQINTATMYRGTTINAGTTGSYYGTNVTATGTNSFAGGLYSTASGIYSLSLGYYNTASGQYSAAFGARSISSNAHAFSMGIDLQATGNRSMVFGSGVTAAVGLGTDLINNIDRSFMIGFNSDEPTFFVGSANGLGTYGNVGIGTKTPLERLHVSGNTKLDGRLVIEHNVTTDWQYGLAIYANRDKTKALSVNAAGTGADLFTVWGNGVVNAKTIYAEEIEVRVDAMGIYWPDYVFRSDYQLRPLSEVESFVQTNKHLPEVPSEAEIFENGLNLGEMDAILLRKIEELTLYVIDQQKKIEQLNAQLDELSTK